MRTPWCAPVRHVGVSTQRLPDLRVKIQEAHKLFHNRDLLRLLHPYLTLNVYAVYRLPASRLAVGERVSLCVIPL